MKLRLHEKGALYEVLMVLTFLEVHLQGLLGEHLKRVCYCSFWSVSGHFTFIICF